jgi:hypothetical protein
MIFFLKIFIIFILCGAGDQIQGLIYARPLSYTELGYTELSGLAVHFFFQLYISFCYAWGMEPRACTC